MHIIISIYSTLSPARKKNRMNKCLFESRRCTKNIAKGQFHFLNAFASFSEASSMITNFSFLYYSYIISQQEMFRGPSMENIMVFSFIQKKEWESGVVDFIAGLCNDRKKNLFKCLHGINKQRFLNGKRSAYSCLQIKTVLLCQGYSFVCYLNL